MKNLPCSLCYMYVVISDLIMVAAQVVKLWAFPKTNKKVPIDIVLLDHTQSSIGGKVSICFPLE